VFVCRGYRGSVRGFGAASTLATGLLVLATGFAAHGQTEARWRPLQRLPGIVDVVGPRSDGRLVIATRTGLFLRRNGEPATRFARGPNGYRPAGGEPYIALARDRRVPGAGCSFRRDEVYALEPTAAPGVVRIDRRGRGDRFADLPAGAFPSGIGFDTVGRFGYRLLVTALFGQSLTVYALDCRGRSAVVLEGGPRVEGGIAVAPRVFGRFAGQLISPDEVGGRLIAIDSRGQSQALTDFAFPAGGDIGPESVGFVPPRFGRRGAAYLADLGAPGSPTEGEDSVLVARGRELVRAGVRPGDLLVATEAGATTFSVRCRQRCTVRRVGHGPSVAHAEGHITLVAAPR
jgi:hypothetical protein